MDLLPGETPVCVWFGDRGIARENLSGRPRAPSQAAQVAF